MQDGRVLALIRPFTDTDFGGDLAIIDASNFVENTQPLAASSEHDRSGADPRHAQ